MRKRRLGSDPEWDAEQSRRIEHLLAHYRLNSADPNIWLKLAFSLLWDFVPGLFEWRERRGRRKANPSERFTALLELDAITRKIRTRVPNLSKRAICKEIKRELAKTDSPFAQLDIKTIERALPQAGAAGQGMIRVLRTPSAVPVEPVTSQNTFSTYGLFGLATAGLDPKKRSGHE